MNSPVKTRVFMSGRSQHVTIPANFRFSTAEVYVERDPCTGNIVLSEKPKRKSMAEVLKELDEAGGANFTLERDHSEPQERDLW